MPDDKSQCGGPDRSRVFVEEQYEVAYFAEKHALSQAAGRRIIEESGPSRENADAAAEKVAPEESSDEEDHDHDPEEGP